VSKAFYVSFVFITRVVKDDNLDDLMAVRPHYDHTCVFSHNFQHFVSDNVAS